MTEFETFYAEIVAANPKVMQAERISITATSFRKQLERTWNKAHAAGFNECDRLRKDAGMDLGANIFEQMFGKRG